MTSASGPYTRTTHRRSSGKPKILRYGIYAIILTGLAALCGLVFSIGSVHRGMVVGCSIGIIGLAIYAVAVIRRWHSNLWLACMWLAVLCIPGTIEIGVLDGALNRNAHDGRQAAFWVAIAGLVFLASFVVTGLITLGRRTRPPAPASTAPDPNYLA